MTTHVPWDRLQPETLDALLEEFLTRDGAVHGHTETPLADQIAAARRRLKSGEAVIVYDEESESWTLCQVDRRRPGASPLGHSAPRNGPPPPERRIEPDGDPQPPEA